MKSIGKANRKEVQNAFSQVLFSREQVPVPPKTQSITWLQPPAKHQRSLNKKTWKAAACLVVHTTQKGQVSKAHPLPGKQ